MFRALPQRTQVPKHCMLLDTPRDCKCWHSHVQSADDGVPLEAVVKRAGQPRQLGIGLLSVPPALKRPILCRFGGRWQCASSVHVWQRALATYKMRVCWQLGFEVCMCARVVASASC